MQGSHPEFEHIPTIIKTTADHHTIEPFRRRKITTSRRSQPHPAKTTNNQTSALGARSINGRPSAGHRTQRRPPCPSEHHAGKEQRSTARGQESPWSDLEPNIRCGGTPHARHRAPAGDQIRNAITLTKGGGDRKPAQQSTKHHQQHPPPPASTGITQHLPPPRPPQTGRPRARSISIQPGHEAQQPSRP